MPAGFRRHLVGKTLINVFHCDIAENALCWQARDHTDIFRNRRTECNLNNTTNLRPLTPHIIRVTRRPAKGGHVLLFEVLSSVRQALALYGKMSGFSQSLTWPHCWLQWHNIISLCLA